MPYWERRMVPLSVDAFVTIYVLQTALFYTVIFNKFSLISYFSFCFSEDIYQRFFVNYIPPDLCVGKAAKKA